MKNITLFVDDHTLEAVRIYAAERQTTVNALVRDYLRQLARQRMQAQAAMTRRGELSEQSRFLPGPHLRGEVE